MPSAVSLTWDQVFAWRLRRQLLAPIGTQDPVGTVRTLCGVQAQVPSAAELAVAVRRDPPEPGALSRALAERAVLRTWAMRGTLHVLAPDHAGAFLSLVAATRAWEQPAWRRTFGAGAEEIELLAATVAEVLDGRVLERDQLIDEVAARVGHRELDAHLRSGWSALLKPLAWMGLLCNGPGRGNRVTFTSPDSWIADWTGVPAPDDAARVAIPAYLGTYGPARIETFDAWLTRGRSRKAELRRWFDELRQDGVLATVELEDGGSAYARADDVVDIRSTQRSAVVRLLPGFDQSVLGPGTGDARIVSPARRREVSKTAGWISPVVLRGGRVVGVWALDGEALTVRLFAEERQSGGAIVSAAALDGEITRLGACLGRELRASVSRT